MNLENFTADALRPHVGSNFQVGFQDGSVDLLLEEVKGMTYEQHANARTTREPFSLFFIGPAQPVMEQSIYPVRHDSLGGPWELFLVPVARRRGGEILYEAAFS